MLDLKTAPTIATSIVHAKLDYCNSLYLNIDITQNKPPLSYSECSRSCCHWNTKHHIKKIPLAQNTWTNRIQSNVQWTLE